MKKKSLLIILFFSVIFSVYSQDTVNVVTYNLLRFNSSTDRNLDFENIMNYISPGEIKKFHTKIDDAFVCANRECIIKYFKVSKEKEKIEVQL